VYQISYVNIQMFVVQEIYIYIYIRVMLCVSEIVVLKVVEAGRNYYVGCVTLKQILHVNIYILSAKWRGAGLSHLT
jgi:hypothetical protein